MEDAFYRKHCRTLTGLQGEPLERAGENVGHLADVLFDVEGNVERFVLDGVGAGGEVPADERVVLDGGTASSAV
jgi:hypothetical protein